MNRRTATCLALGLWLCCLLLPASGCSARRKVVVEVRGFSGMMYTGFSVRFWNSSLDGAVINAGAQEVEADDPFALPVTFGLRLGDAVDGRVRVCVTAYGASAIGDGGCSLDVALARSEVTRVVINLVGTSCGNDILDPWEECDGEELNGESCESLVFSPGALLCAFDCTYDLLSCGGPTICGDGIADPWEECDGADLNGATCATYGLQGTLSCSPGCTHDTSLCIPPAGFCGDGMLDPGEVCDVGDLGGFTTCTAAGYEGGSPACAADCQSIIGCTCTPFTSYCGGDDGLIAVTCDDTGTALADYESCGLHCAGGSCYYASNVPPAAMAACDPSAPELNPANSAWFDYSGATPVINCDPDCGDPTVFSIPGTIYPQGAGTPSLAFFCVSEMNLPGGVVMDAAENLAFVPVIASAGNINIDGDLDIDGFEPLVDLGGSGGPGGGSGGAAVLPGSGSSGAGAGAGAGGFRNVTMTAGGGGGGAGYASAGAAGGDAEMGTQPGGAGGGVYGTTTLSPLVGGSGGGAGGTWMSGMSDPGGGGGGGGAIHLVARGTLWVNGTISASGGWGAERPYCEDGGGGGGSGGSVLLEAPSVFVSGVIYVDGGDGGAADWCAPGGIGASEDVLAPTMGETDPTWAGGGGGGGGGGGRVAVRTFSSPGCLPANVSPDNACTWMPMSTTPP